MTCTGFLTVAPVLEESMAPYVADAIEALEDHDVAYETTPMGTLIEATECATLFDAAAAAHAAVDADRVETSLKIDDERTVDDPAAEKVRAVEAELGRTARSDRD
jgi:uncharacterized protein (TIGR00106 family)